MLSCVFIILLLFQYSYQVVHQDIPGFAPYHYKEKTDMDPHPNESVHTLNVKNRA